MSAVLRPGEIFAGYTIEGVLGRGGMGTVYLARHPRLPRHTALKLLNPDVFADREVRARFEREADLAARLEHPNIVGIYDRGMEDDQPWISLQYVKGTDAATAVARGQMTPLRAVRVATQTAEALDHAHAAGVLHRDVKPANILISVSLQRGVPERVLLGDFGIARARDDAMQLTQVGQIMATLVYASPEQLAGEKLDERSDQYSLACTLFRLLTGETPFSATNPAQAIREHTSAPPPQPSRVKPGIPRAMDAVIARAMAKRAEQRYDSCSDFAAAAVAALETGSGPVPPVASRPVYRPAAPQSSAFSAPAYRPAPPNRPQAPQHTPPTAPPHHTPPRAQPAQATPPRPQQAQSTPPRAQPAQPTPPRAQPAQSTPPRPQPATPNRPQPYVNPANLGARRSRKPLVIGAVVVLLVVAGGFGLFQLVNSPAMTGGWDSDHAPIAAAFPDLVSADADGTGYQGATCYEATVAPPGGAERVGVSCHGPDATYAVWDFGSFATVQQYLAGQKNSRGQVAPTVSTPHPGSAKPLQVTTLDDARFPVLTSYPDDPARSRYIVGTAVNDLDASQILADWWPAAPLS